MRSFLPSAVVLALVLLVFSPSGLSARQAIGISRHVSGLVERRAAAADTWQALPDNHEIFPGDAVRTGPDSSAAILCADESQIRLHENTLMVFKSVAPSGRLGFARPVKAAERDDGSLYEIRGGKAWLRNSNEAFRFELETPAVTAAIRGTEFIVQVAEDGFSRISLLEGRLSIFNSFGALDLSGGEMATARPGQAPVKEILLRPEDAVQWVLSYPGIISFRDLPLTGLAGLGRAGNTAMEAYDRGDLEAAGRLAEQALVADPADPASLTVLGFIRLQRHQPAEALPLLRRALDASPRPEAAARIGYSLALYRLGDPVAAYNAYLSAIDLQLADAESIGMAAFFSLMADKPEQAAVLLDKGLQRTPASLLCRSLRSQMLLIQNRKEEAGVMAAELLEDAPASPFAHLTAGLAAISSFDLERAKTHMRQAILLDPGFVHAHIQLARLQLGAERLDEARQTVGSALALAPDEGLLHNIDGFVKLGHRQYAEARAAFERALAREPSLGEPYMGLAIIDYASGDAQSGLRHVLTATLLDPRISLYQSVLGKALYQSRAFDKALATYEYAARLDPNDPTPHLYRGIALTDLNRPGEAIREINTSIALNGNRAVFRSKLMLDRDLAIRNFSIAKAFAQLGLGEWAYSKALTAAKNDPLNSSAHLFLSSAFASDQQRFAAGKSEYLLYRLLAPANQESFTLFNDYTPMFESPYLRAQVGGTAGEWSSGNGVYGASFETYGGRPGLAGYLYGSGMDDGGMREENGDSSPRVATVMLKYEPTVRDALLGGGTSYDSESGDNTNQGDWDYRNSPFMEHSMDDRYLELGYVRRFSPDATLIVYGKREAYDYRVDDYFIEPIQVDGDRSIVADFTSTMGSESETVSFSTQQQLVLGSHTILAGLDLYRGDYSDIWAYRARSLIDGAVFQSRSVSIENSPDQSNTKVYLFDYWKPLPETVVELGVSYMDAAAPRQGYPDPIEENLLGTRVGLNWQLSDADVLRFAFQRYLNSDIVFQTTLEPSEVAGFPGWLNADFGSTVAEAGFAWERQWNDATFSVFRLDAHRIETPLFEAVTPGIGRYSMEIDRYLARLDINRILTPSLGLWGRLLCKRVSPDDATAIRLPDSDFSEYYGALSLKYLDSRGIRLEMTGAAVTQQFHASRAGNGTVGPRDDESFAIAGVGVGYDFPDKRGRINLVVNNIFDTHFAYEAEPVALDIIYPARQIVLSLYLNF
jgi:Flp pilus assembly protein TadD